MMDDAELLRAYAENRSEPAFAEFVERRAGFVHATALRMLAGNAHTAQDVTQAVFVLAASKSAALARHERLAGWLHTTTCNVSLKLAREASRRSAREQEAARMNEIEQRGANENEISGADTAGFRPMLNEALGALREGEREAVLLRYFEGKPFAEVGLKLSMSEEAARKCVARAVEKMRAAFAKRGVTSSAAALGALMTAEAAQVAPAGLAASVSAGAMATAVASAATAGAGAILAFMSSAKITIAAVAALLIAAGGIFYGVQNERAASAALARAQQENKNLAAQLRALEKQNAAVAAPAPYPTPTAAGSALLAAHPEIREKLLAMEKAAGLSRSFRIAKELNLTPEQSEKLAELMGRGASIGTIRTYKVPGYGDVKFSSAPRVSRNNMAKEARAFLDEATAEKIPHLMDLDYGGVCQSRDLAYALFSTDEPLTSQQARSIDEISLDLSENFSDSTSPEERWKMFQERAKSVLSPGQMPAFLDQGDEYVLIREMSKGPPAKKAKKAAKKSSK